MTLQPVSASVGTARSADAGTFVGISAVERDTGLSKDTLRVWERRYGFPQPHRDAAGERLYPPVQIDTLRLIKRLMDRGMRPGKVIGRPLEELLALGQTDPKPALASAALFSARSAGAASLTSYLDLLRAHAVEDLRRSLSQALLRHGVADFVIGTVAPLTQMIGDAWMSGRLAIYEEHLFTETVQSVLRHAIAALPSAIHTAPASRPHVLLTTFPDEQHGLGLLMVEALLTLEGARCVSLGTATPLDEIARAAQSHGCDIVALSFSQAYPATQLADGLRELRANLPAGTEIWAGGAGSALQKKPPEQVRIIGALSAVHAAVAEWRTLRLPAA